MDTTEIVLHLLDGNYLIAKSEQIVDLSEIQKQQFINLSWDDGYFSYIYHVDAEIGLINKSKEYWRCFKILGDLDFSSSGILSAILEPLSKNDISVLVVSTYRTDLILVPHQKVELAIKVLKNKGYRVV